MRWWSVVASVGLTIVLMAGCSGDTGSGHPGEQVYVRYCFSCHAAGVAGAPRVGDAGAWAPRIARGRDVLLRSTIDGMPPGMPPMGLCSDCSEEQLAEAIDYMIERSRPE